MKNFSIFIVLVAIVIGGYFLVRDKTPKQTGTPEAIEVPKPEGDPKFSWQYSSFEKGEFPYTSITLVAMYQNDMTMSKVVGKVQGGCNDYPEPDADVYDSTMIMCYYAGFGEYFKVVKVGNIYEVRHKEFEEASPDYNPPVMQYETIATF